LIAINGVSALCYFLFYHPPTFKMLYKKSKKSDIIKQFDYVGLFLFSAGLTLLLMGMNWVSTHHCLFAGPSADRLSTGWRIISLEEWLCHWHSGLRLSCTDCISVVRNLCSSERALSASASPQEHPISVCVLDHCNLCFKLLCLRVSLRPKT
jgi:hypothetical protein